MSNRVTPTDLLGHMDTARERRNRWVGVYIGSLAGMLAICNVGSDNASKDAVQANLGASDTWAFFQSKNVRRTVYDIAANQVDDLLDVQRDLPAALREKLVARSKAYRDEVHRLTTSAKTQEGLDELFNLAKSYERKRDIALRRDPYFDWSQALLQIAVVLASVHLIVGNRWLLRVSEGLGVLGILIMLNGFLLLVRLPLLG